MNDTNSRINRDSGSQDPKELVKRILSIAPIVPGQKSASEPDSKHHPAKATSQEPSAAPTEAKTAATNSTVPAQTTNDGPAKAEAKPSAPLPVPAHLSANTHHDDNLIDFNSRPPSVAPPEANTRVEPIAGNPLHPTSDPQPTPVHQSTTLNAPIGNPPKTTTNLMDDDERQLSEMNNGVSSMSLHQPMVPQGRDPLQRADTETSDVDVFVDAEG